MAKDAESGEQNAVSDGFSMNTPCAKCGKSFGSHIAKLTYPPPPGYERCEFQRSHV